MFPSVSGLPFPLYNVPSLDIARLLYSSVQEEYSGKKTLSFTIPGYRDGFTTTSELSDVAEFLTGATLPIPVGNESWEVVSTSASDTAEGVGARRVRITYLDNNWVQKTTEINLSGTAPVPVPDVANCRDIQWMHLAIVGSNNVAVGDIDLRVAEGGTIHERISAGGNQSLTCHYTIPEGYVGYCWHWSFFPTSHHFHDIQLQATCNRDDRALIGPYVFQDSLSLDSNGDNRPVSLVFLPRTRIKVSSKPSNTTAVGVGSFSIYLQEI